MYDRDNPRYPYKSHGQWLKACYGLIASTLLVIFNGVGPFLEHPFDTRRFVASYISVSISRLTPSPVPLRLRSMKYPGKLTRNPGLRLHISHPRL
jgi:hypothetical protein